jgi:hypothetical protein
MHEKARVTAREREGQRVRVVGPVRLAEPDAVPRDPRGRASSSLSVAVAFSATTSRRFRNLFTVLTNRWMSACSSRSVCRPGTGPRHPMPRPSASCPRVQEGRAPGAARLRERMIPLRSAALPWSSVVDRSFSKSRSAPQATWRRLFLCGRHRRSPISPQQPVWLAFVPAEEIAAPARRGQRPSRSAVGSKVLVAAVFRPPALNVPTLGQPPREVTAASDEIAFPLTISMPPFPPSPAGSGLVLLEARVDGNGRVAETAVIHSAPPFDAAARAALTQGARQPTARSLRDHRRQFPRQGGRRRENREE